MKAKYKRKDMAYYRCKNSLMKADNNILPTTVVGVA